MISRYAQIAAIAAIFLAVASATTTVSYSFQSTNFNATPNTVIGATADATNWEDKNAFIFGAGTDNTTIYAYGVYFDDTTDHEIKEVVSRKINTTIVTNGTDSDESSVIGDSPLTSLTIGHTGSFSYPLIQTGPGYLAIVTIKSDGAATNPCNQVYVTTYAGGGSSITQSQIKITSSACFATCTASQDGLDYDYEIDNVWYEDGYFYVAFTTLLQTTPYDGSSGCTAGTYSYYEIMGSVQGVSASSGTAFFTTVPTPYSDASSTLASGTILFGCGPQNYTNSTNIYCAWRDADSSANVKLSIIPRTAATTAGAPSTIATDTSNSTYSAVEFYPAGVVYSNYTQGALIGVKYTAVTSGDETYGLNFYNYTSGASATAPGVDTGISIVGVPVASGIVYGTGYAILSQYTASSTNTYAFTAFFANGTMNGTSLSVGTTGTAAVAGNFFVDPNGDLWFGAWEYTSPDGTVVAAEVGKLIGQIYPSNSGSILGSSFFALLLVVAALFAL